MKSNPLFVVCFAFFLRPFVCATFFLPIFPANGFLMHIIFRLLSSFLSLSRHVWQESDSANLETNIRWADAFILMYSVTDKCSFDECNRLKFLINYNKRRKKIGSNGKVSFCVGFIYMLAYSICCWWNLMVKFLATLVFSLSCHFEGQQLWCARHVGRK